LKFIQLFQTAINITFELNMQTPIGGSQTRVAFVHFSNPPNEFGTGVTFDLNAGLNAGQVRDAINNINVNTILGKSDIN